MKNKFLFLSSVAILSISGLAGCKKAENDKEFAGNAVELGYEVSELENKVLGDYDALYQLAAKITDPSKTEQRYKAFAKAEYELIYGSGLIVPWLAQNGTSASVSKTIPWQAGRASYGLTGDKFKNVVATNSPMTKEERAKVTAIYDAQKAAGAPSHAADENGWISLANDFSNPAFGGDGSYTVAFGGEEIKFEGSRIKKEFRTTYQKEPQDSFLNYLINTWTYNSYHYTNMVDGLVENDKYGNIVGAVADKYKVETTSEGKQVWTFHIRDGVTWVNNATGAKVADVVADDFVASAEYVLNAKNNAGAVSLYQAFVSGANEYYDATAEVGEDDEMPSFESVGVKAISAKEIQYTLDEEAPYFITALTYSPFLPVNRTFLNTQGSEFGKSENNLLVNGAFRITAHETESFMTYTKNESYYDAAHVYVDTVRRQFVAGTKTSADVRAMYENNEIDSFTVNGKDTEGWAKYVAGPDGTGTQKDPYSPACNAITSFGDATFIGYFNFNRTYWDVHNAANKKNYDEKLATAKALLNKNFRLGFLYGLKVEEYLKVYSPDYPIDWCMRSYTNNELCAAGGKDYCEYVDDYYKEQKGITDPSFSLTGIKNGSGKDPILDANLAKQYFDLAKQELIESGELKESDFPIKIDVIGDMDVETRAYQETMYQSLEMSKDVVSIQLNVPANDDEDTEWGSVVSNFDFSMWSGWGPDYADPNTYLHTFCIGGDMVEYLGF